MLLRWSNWVCQWLSSKEPACSAGGAFAVISYNYYSNKIDTLTYAIDEIGFCIVNAFNKTH